jgi:hypothetical protein
MEITVPIMPAGEENNQWFDWEKIYIYLSVAEFC